jgi:hypothetical protein
MEDPQEYATRDEAMYQRAPCKSISEPRNAVELKYGGMEMFMVGVIGMSKADVEAEAVLGHSTPTLLPVCALEQLISPRELGRTEKGEDDRKLYSWTTSQQVATWFSMWTPLWLRP